MSASDFGSAAAAAAHASPEHASSAISRPGLRPRAGFSARVDGMPQIYRRDRSCAGRARWVKRWRAGSGGLPAFHPDADQWLSASETIRGGPRYFRLEAAPTDIGRCTIAMLRDHGLLGTFAAFSTSMAV
jgi:hypothetical protein